jgi:hypothetical protein
MWIAAALVTTLSFGINNTIFKWSTARHLSKVHIQFFFYLVAFLVTLGYGVVSGALEFNLLAMVLGGLIGILNANGNIQTGQPDIASGRRKCDLSYSWCRGYFSRTDQSAPVAWHCFHSGLGFGDSIFARFEPRNGVWSMAFPGAICHSFVRDSWNFDEDYFLFANQFA